MVLRCPRSSALSDVVLFYCLGPSQLIPKVSDRIHNHPENDQRLDGLIYFW